MYLLLLLFAEVARVFRHSVGLLCDGPFDNSEKYYWKKGC